ncbi:MAG: hypothetical protein ACP5QH_06025 [Thermoplasmata archaeon]|jgi:hypothetical protein
MAEEREGRDQTKTHKVNGSVWDIIQDQIFEFVHGFEEPWEGTYAVLLYKHGTDVSFERLPSASEEYWGRELPWILIGTVEGRGLDGMVIDVEYDGHRIHEKGYFNINID